MIGKIILPILMSVLCVYAQVGSLDTQPAVLASPTHQVIPQQCFGCICEASSHCDLKAGCRGDVCGPFSITWGYWADGGKPTLNNEKPDAPSAYANCVNDVGCAARTVQGYIDRYAQDCNGDGVMNCDDYVRLHRLGGYGCNGPIDPKYMESYQSCMKYVNNN
ncbi:hypothetical protein PV327_005216 [Microctonus hyperodae]|uniref:lysozyme n=1 Tax=Microctonus hyperodae TaxID=165561 RepID=A0AA39G1C6_MICHY|nr:hypothetical protein PV327_005216 [Microctonus hyperodae]